MYIEATERNPNDGDDQWRTEGVWGVQTSRNSEVLTKPSRIPCSVENTSVTTL
jgi:hypothetical protein